MNNKRYEYVGSQVREKLETTDYKIYQKVDGGYLLVDDFGFVELWVENDNYSGYVVVINGVGHEFVSTETNLNIGK